MNSTWATVLMIFSAFFAAVSQLMLKKSADLPHENLLKEYLNKYVIGGYIILFITTLFNMVALVYLPLKIVTALGTASYVFVVVLSKFSLKETIGGKKLAGMLLIIAGILIFTLLN